MDKALGGGHIIHTPTVVTVVVISKSLNVLQIFCKAQHRNLHMLTTLTEDLYLLYLYLVNYRL
jgi:hypothetical protein